MGVNFSFILSLCRLKKTHSLNFPENVINTTLISNLKKRNLNTVNILTIYPVIK